MQNKQLEFWMTHAMEATEEAGWSWLVRSRNWISGTTAVAGEYAEGSWRDNSPKDNLLVGRSRN